MDKVPKRLNLYNLHRFAFLTFRTNRYQIQVITKGAPSTCHFIEI